MHLKKTSEVPCFFVLVSLLNVGIQKGALLLDEIASNLDWDQLLLGSLA